MVFALSQVFFLIQNGITYSLLRYRVSHKLLLGHDTYSATEKNSREVRSLARLYASSIVIFFTPLWN